MRSEWEETRWGNIAELKYGKALRDYKHGYSKIPVYGTNGLVGTTETALCNHPGVIIGRKGAYRGVHYSTQPFYVIDTAFFLEAIDNKVFDYKWAYYYLTTVDLNSMDSGSAIPSTSREDFYNLPVTLPSLPEQHAIAATLSCLDDKIKLNNKINANLEAQAQAIFKSWFVDFEPLRNGEFVDSELGPIPKGWQVGNLSDIGTIVGGATPSKAKEEYYILSGQGIPWITPKDLSINKDKYIYHGEMDITDAGYKNSSTRIMPQGSVLFSSRAPIGYIAIAANKLCTNQGFKSVIPNKNIGTEFIYYTLKSNLETIQNLGSGSTFKEVSGSVMKNVPVLIPDSASIKEFSGIVSTLTAQQKILEGQSRALAALRDALLPKLMSGEIEVPTAI